MELFPRFRFAFWSPNFASAVTSEATICRARGSAFWPKQDANRLASETVMRATHFINFKRCGNPFLRIQFVS
jgi:hypothetical protein